MNMKALNAVLLVLVAVGAIFYFYNGRDERGLGERLDDASANMSQGLDEAAEQIGDQTPAEKAGDAIGDAARDVRNSAN